MASDKSFTDSFIDADPTRALEELNVALGETADNADWLCQRAYAHILLKDYNRAVDDAQKAQQLQPGMALAFLRTGISEYHLNNISAAHQAFTAGKGLDGANEAFQMWIRYCEEKMATQGQNGTSNLQTVTPHVKRDWYQTESQVTVTLMVKNVKKEDVSIVFQEKELRAKVNLPSGEDYYLNICLLHPVVPEYSTYKILSTKPIGDWCTALLGFTRSEAGAPIRIVQCVSEDPQVEIKMKKTEAIRWEKLEGEGVLPDFKHFSSSSNQYPSSSHYTRNWDKLVGDIKEEEKNENLEGDAALNKLFQQIYGDGSDEVKRAMNKSFMESGGTVLSTNWTDVGKRKVDVNPPDDMEWKQY